VPIPRVELCDPRRAVMRDRIHQVMVAAHLRQITRMELVERQVDRAAPAVTRLSCHVAVFEHGRPVDIGIVPSFCPSVFGLLRPPQEAIDGALRPIPVPEEKAETPGRRQVSSLPECDAQRPGPDDAVREIPVHGPPGEVVPGGVLRVPPNAWHDVVDEDEFVEHHVSLMAEVTAWSMTSESDHPAAAIIFGKRL
jgi:hypothetical protein